MKRELKPDFERYLKALHCEEPDRVPQGDWHVDHQPKEAFMGKSIKTLQDHVDFWHAAGFDFVTASSGILEPVRAPEGMTTKGEAVHTEYGDKVPREWAHEHEGMISTWEKFEKYKWPTADDFDLSKWGAFDRILPKGMKAILLLGKIYTTAWMYMGAETFFNALEGDEELAGRSSTRSNSTRPSCGSSSIPVSALASILTTLPSTRGFWSTRSTCGSMSFPGTRRWGRSAAKRGSALFFTATGTVRRPWRISSTAVSMASTPSSPTRWISSR
jgi:hypothetical protein